MQINRQELHTELDTLGEQILDTLDYSIRNHFDIFAAMLSNIIWQSPSELASKLLNQLTPVPWKILQDSPNNDIEIRQKKEVIRKGIITDTARTILALGRQKNILQRFTTRLLVQETLAQMLPHNDQDRIIAAELLMSYRNWKRLLTVITTHAIISEERILVEKPFSYIDINGRDTCVLTVNGHIDPVKSIQELPITHTQKFEYARHGLLIMGVSVPTSDITIEEPTLIRHDAMTPIREKEDIVRASVFEQLGHMPAYKRRCIGDKTQKPEPRAEWRLNGA